MTDQQKPKAAPRKEYTLKSPDNADKDAAVLVQGGVEHFAGDKVKLNANQAKRLKDSGCLV